MNRVLFMESISESEQKIGSVSVNSSLGFNKKSKSASRFSSHQRPMLFDAIFVMRLRKLTDNVSDVLKLFIRHDFFELRHWEIIELQNVRNF